MIIKIWYTEQLGWHVKYGRFCRSSAKGGRTGANDCSFLLPDCSLLVSIKQLELEKNPRTYEGPMCSSSSITLWCKILGSWTSQHFVRRTLSFWRHSRCLCLISGSSSFCPPLLIISRTNDDLRMLFRKSRSRSLKTNTKMLTSAISRRDGSAPLHDHKCWTGGSESTSSSSSLSSSSPSSSSSTSSS